MHNDKVEHHQSYGVINASRVNSSRGIPLYGASMTHATAIKISLYRSEKIRNLSHDRYFPTKELFTIYMSQADFANFITSLNAGSGTPCTIDHVMGEQMPECPMPVDRKNEIHFELNESINKAAAELKELIAECDTLLENQKPLNKTQKLSLSKKLHAATSLFESTIPFLHKSFMETVDNTISVAKNEINAVLTDTMIDLGKQQIKQRLTDDIAIALPWKDKV